jgi:hypothetical protein
MKCVVCIYFLFLNSHFTSENWGLISTVAWMHYTPDALYPAGSLSTKEESRMKAEEAEHQKALRDLQLVQNAVSDLEHHMGLVTSWTTDSEEYQTTVKYVEGQWFIRAIETLESLVVTHMFELAKANLMGTCKSYNYFCNGGVLPNYTSIQLQVLRCASKYQKLLLVRAKLSQLP